MNHHSKKGEKVSVEDELVLPVRFIVEIPEVVAWDDMESYVECFKCKKRFRENTYAVNALRRLRLDTLCISCDPAAEERDWFGVPPLV